jgi:hypothetical protein
MWEVLRTNLQHFLPFWECTAQLPGLQGEWKSRVQDRLRHPNQYMTCLAEGVRRVLGDAGHEPSVHIPALILPQGVAIQASEVTQGMEPERVDDDSATSEQQDPLETLFIQVNAAGTPLVGEELMYSILKSIWPDAQRFVEDLSTRFMMPSRLVMLLSRLILARALAETDAGRERPPAPPDVGRFRRLIHGDDPQCPDFRHHLTDFLMKGEAKALLNQARTLLIDTKDDGQHGIHYRLPPVLAADLARHAPEAFFLFLTWLDRMRRAGCDPLCLNTAEQQRLLGAVTALGWFAEKPADCLTTLWGCQQQLERHSLSTFFSKGALKPCLQLTDYQEMQFIPLLPPDMLQSAVDEAVTQARGYKTPAGEFWRIWQWWDWFAGTFQYKETVESWYAHRLRSWKQMDDVDGKALRLKAWTKFADALKSKRALVLYAQRTYLRHWFPQYDPSSPDQVEDTDRPWDMDHIHPQKYVYGRWKIPPIIKEWHSSIGNLRAWPLEANRADGDDPPHKKLGIRLPACREMAGWYGLTTEKGVRNASFVSSDWPHWQASTPDDEWFPVNYIAKPEEYPSCRGALITAITSRWVALYREWYETLLVGDLFR